jgi:hypothetical protein
MGSSYRGISETDEGEFWKRSIFLSMGALRGKPGRRASLLGALKDMSRKALETGIFLHRGSLEGDSLTGDFGIQSKNAL